jgi:hypothetical protein
VLNGSDDKFFQHIRTMSRACEKMKGVVNLFCKKIFEFFGGRFKIRNFLFFFFGSEIVGSPVDHGEECVYQKKRKREGNEENQKLADGERKRQRRLTHSICPLRCFCLVACAPCVCVPLCVCVLRV